MKLREPETSAQPGREIIPKTATAREQETLAHLIKQNEAVQE